MVFEGVPVVIYALVKMRCPKSSRSQQAPCSLERCTELLRASGQVLVLCCFQQLRYMHKYLRPLVCTQATWRLSLTRSRGFSPRLPMLFRRRPVKQNCSNVVLAAAVELNDRKPAPTVPARNITPRACPRFSCIPQVVAVAQFKCISTNNINRSRALIGRESNYIRDRFAYGHNSMGSDGIRGQIYSRLDGYGGGLAEHQGPYHATLIQCTPITMHNVAITGVNEEMAPDEVSCHRLGTLQEMFLTSSTSKASC